MKVIIISEEHGLFERIYPLEQCSLHIEMPTNGNPGVNRFVITPQVKVRLTKEQHKSISAIMLGVHGVPDSIKIIV